MKISRHIIHVFLFLLLTPVLWAQQTEEDIRKEANDLFEQERYVAATPLFLRLLSLNPKDYDYNFKYGTCLLFNSNRKNQGLRYLNYAVKDPNIDPRAYYFHGKALHLDYQFDQAIKSYKKYLDKVDGKPDKRYHVKREIEMCENGKRLLTTFTDIIVADKKEIDQDKFFRIYTDVQTIGGDILVSEQFQSKIDKKKGHVPVVHFPPNAKAVYYASYGDDEDTGLDIFIRRRLPDGSWGLPEKLPGDVNTDEDEDFPYMHPSGRFLYFSSKGHNSMGGYDVFMSRYRESTNDFGPPENVDFAISSPDDDLFYVVDSLFQNAYFASARQSENGKLHVYRVKVARVPIQEVIVMGDFESTISPASAQMFVTIKNHSNGQEVTKSESNNENKYAIVFPQGGKYEYEIEITTSQGVRTFIVEIPFLEEFRPLKQKILHTMEDGQEIVKVINLFDEEVENAEEIIASVIRKKAELEVNIDNFDIEKLEAEQRKKEMLAEMGYENMRMDEITGQLLELKGVQSANEKQMNIITSNIEKAIIKRADQIREIEEEQKKLDEKIAGTTDPIEKHQLLSMAKQKEFEKRALVEEIQALDDFKAKTVETMSKGASEEVDVAEIESEFNRILENEDETEAIMYLHANKEAIEKVKGAKPEAMLESLVKERVKVKDELDDVKSTEAAMEKRIKDLKTNINVNESNLQSAKKKEAERLREEIEKMKREISAIQEEKKYIQQEKTRVSQNLNKIDSQIATLQEAVRQKEPAVIDEGQLDAAIADAKKIKTNQQGTQYDQELDQIEQQYPELAQKTYISEEPEDVSLNDIRRETSAKEQEINNNGSLSEKQKVEQLINNSKKVNEQVQEKIDELNKRLSNDPENNSLKNELAELQEYKTIQETKLSQYEAELEQLNETVEVNPELAAINSGSILDEVSPGYENSISKVKNDNSLTELGKTEEIIRIQNELLNQLNNEESKVTTALTSDPDNKALQKRKEVLDEIIAETNRSVQQNEARKDQLIAQQTSTVNRTDVINKVNTTYNSRRNEIESSNRSPEEKQEALLALEKDLVNGLQDQKEALETSLRENPEDTRVKEELELVDALIEEKESAIASIEESSEVTSPELTEAELLEEVMPDYEERSATISGDENLSDLEKQEQLNELDEALLSEAQKELSDVEKKLNRDPENKTLTDKKEGLEQMITAKEEKIAEREQIINALQGETSVVDMNQVKEKVLSDVDPDYTVMKKQIEEGSEDKLVELNALIALEEGLVSDLEDKNKALEKALKKDPENKDIEAELQATEALLKEHNEELEELREQAATVEKMREVLAESSELVEELYPEYVDKMDEITSDDTQSEFVKVSAQQREDQELLSRIENELDKTNEILKVEPGNKEQKTRKDELEQLKDVIENRIEQREEEISELSSEAGVASVEEIREEIRTSAAGDYENKINRIEDSGLSEVEQAELKIELEKDAQAALKDQREKLLTQTAREPGNEEASIRLNIVNELIEESETRVEELKKVREEKAEKERVLASTENLINDLAPEYNGTVEAIQKDQTMSATEKLIALQELDNNLLQAVQQEITRIENELVNDPDNTELISTLNDLKSLERVLETEIERRQARIDETTMAASKSDEESKNALILSEISPDYVKQVEEVSNSSDSDLEKDERILNIETNLKQDLLEARESLEKAMKKDPENQELKERLVSIETLMQENNERIEGTRSRIKENIAGTERYENILQAIDASYKEDIQTIEAEGSTEQFKEIADRESELQQKLIKAIEAKKKKLEKKYTVEDDLELIVLENLLEESEQREADAEIKDASGVSAGAKQDFIDDLRSDLLGENKNALTQENTDLDDLKKQDDALAVYETALQEEIKKIKNDPEFGQSSEMQQQLKWLEDEVEAVTSKRAEIQSTIAEMEVTPELASAQQEFITEVREESLGRLSGEVDKVYEDSKKLKQQDAILSRYERKLEDRINELKADPELATSEQKQEELAWLEEELGNVQTKREQVKASIEQLESGTVAQTQQREEFVSAVRKEVLGENAEDMEREYSSISELQEQDRRLQNYENKLNEEIEKLENDQELSTSEEKKNQLAWLKEEREAVQAKRRRVQISIGELETETITASEEKKADFIQEKRKEILGDNSSDMEQEFTTQEELELQDARLEAYEESLDREIEKLEEDPELATSEEKKEQLAWLEDEKTSVQRKRMKISVSIGELTTSVVADKSSDPVINKLNEEEQEAEAVMNDETASRTEIKQAEKRLEEIKEKKLERENELIAEDLTEAKSEKQEVEEELDELIAEESSPSLEKLKDHSTSEQEAIDGMVQSADNANSEAEKKFIMEQAVSRQEKLADEVAEVITEEKISRLEEEAGVNLNNKEDLERKKRKFMVDIGDLTMEIERTKEQISSAKRKDKPALENKKASLEDQRALLQERLEKVNNELSQSTEIAPVITDAALDQEVTFNEERKLAATDEYKEYEEKATEALELEEQIATLESELTKDKRELAVLVERSSSEQNEAEIQAKVAEIKETQTEIDQRNIELVQKRYEAEQALPQNEEQAMKFQNLALRGVKPIQTTAVAVAMLNLPSSGFAIDTTAKENVYTAEKAIPVDVKSPKGLVYRVQIGAFRNDIPQDLFSEFNPVSGEKIGNTGITRYMAGFFTSSESVSQAREQIRELGYSDAFVVAYCDGKRVGFGDARRMEAAGTCVPQGENKLMLEVATNTAEALGLPVKNEVEELPDYSYAQAPGAAPSQPIELTTGLFFTVQIGVFSKPISRKDILNMEDLFTIRLPNGTIRYNTGMFDSVEEAKERKQLANDKGLRAFVTAYFEGERITIEEAEELLAQRGNSILQTRIADTEDGKAPEYEVPQHIVRTDTVESNVKALGEDENLERIQIVTKKSFDEFPRDILNRYNAKGTFYYDSKDGKVKSVITNNPAKLPRVFKFRQDVDTVYLDRIPADTTESNIISIKFREDVMAGDFMDWLLRFNYRREFERIDTQLVLRLYGIEPDKTEEVLSELRKFGLNPEVLTISEEELRLQQQE